MNETAGPKQEIIKNTPKKNEGIDISYSNKNWKVEFTLWDTKNLSQKELDFINRLLESKKEEANKMIEEITKNSWAKRRELANSIIKELKSRWERWNKKEFDNLIARTKELFSLSDGEKVAQTMENIAGSKIVETTSEVATWNKNTFRNVLFPLAGKAGDFIDYAENEIRIANAPNTISSFNVEKDKWDIKKVKELQEALLALWKKDLGKVDGKWWPLTQGALENYVKENQVAENSIRNVLENLGLGKDVISNLLNVKWEGGSESPYINTENIKKYIELTKGDNEMRKEFINLLKTVKNNKDAEAMFKKFDKDIAQVQENGEKVTQTLLTNVAKSFSPNEVFEAAKEVDDTKNKEDIAKAKNTISSFNVEKDKWDIKKVEDLQNALLALWKKDLGKVDGKWWPLTQGALENYVKENQVAENSIRNVLENLGLGKDVISNLLNVKWEGGSESPYINTENIKKYIELTKGDNEMRKEFINLLKTVKNNKDAEAMFKKIDKDIAQVQERRNNNNPGRAVV